MRPLSARAEVCIVARVDEPQRGDEDGHDTHTVDLVSFLVYCLLYAGFMGLVAFAPDVLATRVLGGVNLAVAYGMGLILAAVVLAVVATWLRRGEKRG
jgi:uncharacterized membrane protein (DUF485 family)